MVALCTYGICIGESLPWPPQYDRAPAVCFARRDYLPTAVQHIGKRRGVHWGEVHFSAQAVYFHGSEVTETQFDCV
jgi:hypothetical protein